MTLEDCRLAMIEHNEALIEKSALTLAGMLYPDFPLEIAMEITREFCRKSLYDALPAETKLFLEPTGRVC